MSTARVPAEDLLFGWKFGLGLILKFPSAFKILLLYESKLRSDYFRLWQLCICGLHLVYKSKLREGIPTTTHTHHQKVKQNNARIMGNTSKSDTWKIKTFV